MTLLSCLAVLLVAVPARGHEPFTAGENNSGPSLRPSLSYCEDFAKRQTRLADRLLAQSNYAGAIKVLNSTAQKCNVDFVRTKLFDVYTEWYGTVRRAGSASDLREFVDAVSNQSYLTSVQRAQLNQRAQSGVLSNIRQTFQAERYEEAHRVCQNYPSYASEDFEAEYFCGRAAQEAGAEDAAMSSYAWLLDNWVQDQNLASWTEISTTLEELYFLNGRFQAAYGLAQQNAVRNPSPERVLASLYSVRGKFLSPLARVASNFYDSNPSEEAVTYVQNEMQRVKFPPYVRAFYIMTPDGTIDRGMYGSEANEPPTGALQNASGAVSLLRSDEGQNLAWLVSPVGSRFLVLEIGAATTADENVRLESVLKNIESDAQWKRLRELEFEQTSPASGSAIGTILIAASIDETDLAPYDALFDDSPVLAYYCIQTASEEIEASFNFDRSKLGYGDERWANTSNTPALYHHSIQYQGQPLREVVWPKFVDDEWTGVVRVGLAHS